MRKACTCRGSNPNCSRCFGRGYYDETESTKGRLWKSRMLWLGHNAGVSVRNPPRKKKVEPLSSRPFPTKILSGGELEKSEPENSELLPRHRKRIHSPISPRGLSNRQTGCYRVSGPKPSRPPRTKSPVNRFIGASAQNSDSKPKLSRTISPGNRELTKCPYCNSMVRGDRLPGHIKKIHDPSPSKGPPE